MRWITVSRVLAFFCVTMQRFHVVTQLTRNSATVGLFFLCCACPLEFKLALSHEIIKLIKRLFVFRSREREREMFYILFPREKARFFCLSLSLPISPYKHTSAGKRKGCPPRPRTNACTTPRSSSTIITTRRKEDRAAAVEKL